MARRNLFSVVPADTLTQANEATAADIVAGTPGLYVPAKEMPKVIADLTKLGKFMGDVTAVGLLPATKLDGTTPLEDGDCATLNQAALYRFNGTTLQWDPPQSPPVSATLPDPSTANVGDIILVNAAKDGYRFGQQINVSPANFMVGDGVPGAGIGEDGFYFEQIDAVSGENNVWGPKAAGAWPAQADFKTFNPLIGQLLDFGDGTEGPKPKTWSAETLLAMSDYILVTANGTQMLANRSYKSEGFSVILPAAPADGQWCTIRNTRSVTSGDRVGVTGGTVFDPGSGAPLGAGASVGAGLEYTATYSDAKGGWELGTSLEMALELDDANTGTVLRGSTFVTFKSMAVGNTVRLPALPVGVIRLLMSRGSTEPVTIEQFDTGGTQQIGDEHNNVWPSLEIPADKIGQIITIIGRPAQNRWEVYRPWEIDHSHEDDNHILDKINVHVRSAGTNASSNVAISFDDIDGNTYADSDWLVSGTLTQYAGGTTTIVLDRAPWTGGLGIGRNKDGTLSFEHIGANPNGLSAVNYVGVSGANSDGVIDVRYLLSNEHDTFPNKAAVTPVKWTTIRASGLPVEHRADNESSVVGKTNLRYQDDTVGAVPAVVLGQEYADSVVPVNRGDTPGPGIEAVVTAYIGADIGNGPEWVIVPGGSSDIPIVRYTADGPIEDKDHRAIFEAGAVNMTLPVSTQDRLIQIISEGPATIITADGTEQFTGAAGTSADSILNVNETFQWASILGRGAAAGWSQYVGLVATAQSVGAMVDFSESPGPGDAGSFSLALTNSGANLRYILTLTCSNGTNFSPPLDVDDGINRWWYDFDHTTGVVNIRRFGAFAGGSVRGVALYS